MAQIYFTESDYGEMYDILERIAPNMHIDDFIIFCVKAISNNDIAKRYLEKEGK